MCVCMWGGAVGEGDERGMIRLRIKKNKVVYTALVALSRLSKVLGMDGRTDIPTDRRTDGQTFFYIESARCD